MVKLTIDGIETEAEAGTVIIQAAEQLGIEIPRFCYHERLAIAGNCRMCLVEVTPGPPKPAASCAMPVAEGMVVKTNSPMVKKAREGVMEFLLINHPLDCPICDQGGECDLQDQSMYFGKGESRYPENKRGVADKYMGPLIKTFMTRCIHCTRCIRFTDDIAGIEEMGALGRGEHMEITTYLEKSLTSELSANVVDLCPVGALTSKPYAFHARPWELKKTESVDVMDALGSNIRVDSRGNEVMRVLPRNNDDVNEEWISDKTRHACDGLKMQRLDKPYVRVNGKLKAATWEEAFTTIARKIAKTEGSQIAAIAGDQADVETMWALKKLLNNIGSENLDCRQDGSLIDNSSRGNYIFNSTVNGIDEADAILLIGTNPSKEAAVLNVRLRRAFMRGAKIYNIGKPIALNYKYKQLGDEPKQIEAAAKLLEKAQKPMVIIGANVFTRADGAAIAAASKLAIKQGWNGFNVLQTASSRVGGLDVGFVPGKKGKATNEILKSSDIKILYLLATDELDITRDENRFVIYQGHHGDKGASVADVILPGSAYTEKEATYVNLEGRVQRTQKAVFAPGEAKEDWKIIRALSESIEQTLPFNELKELRDAMFAEIPHLARTNEIAASEVKLPESKTKLSTDGFEYTITNFHMTCPISRSSKTMAECVALAQNTAKKAA
jgi:NADH-quinone oxidoreductase subunit G